MAIFGFSYRNLRLEFQVTLSPQSYLCCSHRLSDKYPSLSVASFSARAASAASCCCFLMILCSLAMHHEVGALCLPLNQTSVSRAGEGLSASSTHERTSATRSKKAHGMRMRVKVRAAGMGVSRETQTARGLSPRSRDRLRPRHAPHDRQLRASWATSHFRCKYNWPSK